LFNKNSNLLKTYLHQGNVQIHCTLYLPNNHGSNLSNYDVAGLLDLGFIGNPEELLESYWDIKATGLATSYPK